MYRIYDLQGEYQQHSLSAEAAELGIVDARIHDNGLVALTSSLTLFEVKNWDGGRPLSLANPGTLASFGPTSHLYSWIIGLSEPPHAWTIIPPDLNISRHVEVLLSVEATILTVDNLECVDQRLSRGPFTHISPSPNGKSLALLTLSGILWVVSTDFQRSMAEFETDSVIGTGHSVHQVEWCGNDAILVTWDGQAVLVGPFGDTLQWDSIVSRVEVGSSSVKVFLHWVSICCDGNGRCTSLRSWCLWSDSKSTRCGQSSNDLDFSDRNIASTLSIFGPGSIAPSAILYDAWESYNNRSPKADESIRSIKTELAKAVDECIEAAGQEWEPHWQRRLLNVCLIFPELLHQFSPANAGSKVWSRILRFLQPYRFREYGSSIESFECCEVLRDRHTTYLFAVRCHSPLTWVVLIHLQIQLRLSFTLDNSIDVTQSTPPGTTYILVSKFKTGHRTQTLGMCQNCSHKTFGNRWRRWTERRWRSMCNNRWEVSITRRDGRQLRRYRETCMGSRPLTSRDKGTLDCHLLGPVWYGSIAFGSRGQGFRSSTPFADNERRPLGPEQSGW